MNMILMLMMFMMIHIHAPDDVYKKFIHNN